MKFPNILIVTLLISCVLSCNTELGAEKRIASEREALLLRIDEFNTAFKLGDVEKLSSMITDNYQHTNGSAKAIGKENWIAYLNKRSAEIVSGELEVLKYVMDDIDINFHKDMAIVTARVFTQNKRKEEIMDNAFRVTNVWIKQRGNWKRAGFHDGKITQ